MSLVQFQSMPLKRRISIAVDSPLCFCNTSATKKHHLFMVTTISAAAKRLPTVKRKIFSSMSLETQINNDIKQAMLAKQKDVLESLRAIKSALLLLKTSKDAVDGVVPEAVEVATLQKLVKQRKEAADIYVQQSRQDLADEELFQASIIERYLPKQLTREEIESAVRQIIAEVGATSPKDMGKVMGVATKKFAGQADNKVVSEVVKELLMS